MKENKKPQWLIDAEKATQEFNESKAGKLSDSELNHRYISGLGAKSQLEKGVHNFQLMSKEQRSENARKVGVFKNSELQRELSKRGHQKKLETGYYETEEFKERSAHYARELNNHPWECKTCGKSGTHISHWKRWGHHDGTCLEKKGLNFNKSTLKQHDLLFEHVHGEFTLDEAREIGKTLNISPSKTYKWVKAFCEVVKKGKGGVNGYPGTYKKKEE